MCLYYLLLLFCPSIVRVANECQCKRVHILRIFAIHPLIKAPESRAQSYKKKIKTHKYLERKIKYL